MNPLKTKWRPQPFKKDGRLKTRVGTITVFFMNRCLDCIQFGMFALGTSDDLSNFADEFIKNKMAAAAI